MYINYTYLPERYTNRNTVNVSIEVKKALFFSSDAGKEAQHSINLAATSCIILDIGMLKTIILTV
jgi:hypothetical protein